MSKSKLSFSKAGLKLDIKHCKCEIGILTYILLSDIIFRRIITSWSLHALLVGFNPFYLVRRIKIVVGGRPVILQKCAKNWAHCCTFFVWSFLRPKTEEWLNILHHQSFKLIIKYSTPNLYSPFHQNYNFGQVRVPKIWELAKLRLTTFDLPFWKEMYRFGSLYA